MRIYFTIRSGKCVGVMVFLVLFLVLGGCCFGQGVTIPSTPESVLNEMLDNPELVRHPNGEAFCWNAGAGMEQYVENYRLTKNRKWLDAGVRYFDFLIGKLVTDPDGYKGWIGDADLGENYWQDALVGDAILFGGMLDFSILVLEDSLLKPVYNSKALSYVEAAKRNFVEKWDKRGCWVDDDPYGGYIGHDKGIDARDPRIWKDGSTFRGAGVSHPFNKQMDAGLVCIKLFRVTKIPFYRERAVKIFFTVKSHFQYFDDHYCWNYFEPLYPGDVDVEGRTTRHGVWVHPWRSGYQAGEVQKIVEAYHYGIVFDETDIRRIINTNLKVMWNKDLRKPRFINSNGLGGDGDTAGIAGFQQAWGHSNAIKNSGELWSSLADFDPTIRRLYEMRFKGDTGSFEYLKYKSTVLASPPGFGRKHSKTYFPGPPIGFSESRELNLAVVLPHRIGPAKRSIIICQSWIPGEMRIDVYGTDGKKKAGLFKGNIEAGMFMIGIDGRTLGKEGIGKGRYKIRWTIGSGFREFPVVVE